MLCELPCFNLPGVSPFGQYPALQWQQEVTRWAVKRSIDGLIWIQELVEHAQYAQVPIGLIAGSDWQMRIADLLFARTLYNSGHVLWPENNELPDLVGRFSVKTFGASPFSWLSSASPSLCEHFQSMSF